MAIVESHERAAKQAKILEKTNESGGGDSVLPVALVEKIISRIPFPDCFKVLLLSKIWHDKFHSSGEGTMKFALTTLQKEIISVSTNWTTYSPVFLRKDGIRVFDRVSLKWKSMFSLSHLPVNYWSSVATPISVGSLICVSPAFPTCDRRYEYEPRRGKWARIKFKRHFRARIAPTSYDGKMGKIIHGPTLVTNLITRKWREFHLPSKDDGKIQPNHVKLLPGEDDTFRVLALFIVSHEDEQTEAIQTHVYDSRVSTWSVTTSQFFKFVGSFFDDSLYLNGKLYCLCEGEGHWQYNRGQLWIHNVDTDKAWIPVLSSVLHIDEVEDRIEFDTFVAGGGILLCSEKIMVVMLCDNGWDDTTIEIYEFDPDSLQFILVSGDVGSTMFDRDGDNWNYWLSSWEGLMKRLASDNDFIYFGQIYTAQNLQMPILTYNVNNAKLSWLPSPCHGLGSMDNGRCTMLGSILVPGRNPFAAV